jgi:DNA-binding transcriptional LysR family regulator
MQELLRSGALLEVLPEHTCEPLPVSLVFSRGRGLPRRVRAVMAFLTEAMAPAFS